MNLHNGSVSRPFRTGTVARLAKSVFTVFLFGLLVLSLLVGVAPNADARAVQLGEYLWPGYAATLRSERIAPSCELEPLKARLATCPAQQVAANEAAEADPFASEAATADDCEALANLIGECQGRHTRFEEDRARLTLAVLRFRSIELAISALAQFAYLKHLLVLVVLFGALVTTATRQHIALRNPVTRLEHRAAQLAQFVAHALWLASCVVDWQVQQDNPAQQENPMLPVLWSAGFAAFAAINLWHLFWIPKDVKQGPTTVMRVLMVVPLYATMGLIASAYFLLIEQHPSGQAIYLHKFVQIPSIYTGVGLYVWAGMLLARTAVARLSFDAVARLRLSPGTLAWLVMVLGAYPVAYSGASGVFVIAVGAVIYQQLRAVGASRRMAVAATAMSGSLGVVLRPCLIVVLIAMLNKQVTTDELFYWGRWVFLLTSALCLLAFFLWNRWEAQPTSAPRAPMMRSVPEAFRALRPLVPYALVAIGVLVIYAAVFRTTMSEHTAAFVVPVIMLCLVLWDRLGFKRDELDVPLRGVWPALRDATNESARHVGALLLMMCGSVALGGVVERSEIIEHLPTSLGSIWVAMTVVVVVMIAIGMTMDEMGAVVLVSVSLAPFAYRQGIDPTHFWMVVLVGFELGYLAPPVALNQLLARQVIGPEAELETSDPLPGFLERYTHVLVPCAIMGIALLVVAYLPLFFL